ncbi:MAG: 3'-5' exonuclease [Sediminibacterium sp.]|nr:3'-5' exonuclease [Sediminibacterium sp.]
MYKIDYMNIRDLIILDIETVPAQPSFTHLSAEWKALFTEKASKIVPFQGEMEDLYKKRAGIWAEFGKIVCIVAGVFSMEETGKELLHLVSFDAKEEVQILRDFSLFCEKSYSVRPGLRLAGHNIREFDIPFIGRRMLINGLPLPQAFQIQDKKPWELMQLDTLQFWKWGDYKNYVSLHLLASVLQIPSSKTGITGSQVQDVYYREGNLGAIVDYCRQDVVATTRVIQKLHQLPPIEDEQIKILEFRPETMFTTLW